MSTITTQPAAVFDLDVRQGCYVAARPDDKFVKVTVTVPDMPPVALLFPADMPHEMFAEGAHAARPWSVLAVEAVRLRNASTGTERADVVALANWLADPANVDAFDQAWAVERLRRLRKRLRKTGAILADHCRRWGLEVPGRMDVEALADSIGVLGDISDAAGGAR